MAYDVNTDLLCCCQLDILGSKVGLRGLYAFLYLTGVACRNLDVQSLCPTQ